MSTNFTPTTAELALVNQIFAQADTQKLGILTGDVAVRVFSGAKLSGPVLRQIWTIADEENNGWLSKKGVAIALRLIAHAQKGEKVTPTLSSKPGPLPVIEGYSVLSKQNTGMSAPKSPPPGFPPLSPQDKIKFENIFNRYGPINGLLSGVKARDVFLKSKLSNDQLMQIWNLADTQDRGALDSTDFTIAMYFIQGLMSQQISFVPTTLPPGLYEQAGGLPSKVSPSVITHLSGNSGSFSPVNAGFGRIQTQYPSQNQAPGPDHIGLSPQSRAPTLPARPGTTPFRPVSAMIQGNGHDVHWDISPPEKTEADSFFDELDSKKVGYIEGDVAVPFMLKSNLPGEDLAQIWDLADINSDGRLTRDGFAIALHLIKKTLAGKPLPAALPLSLVPPSSRGQGSLASPFQTSALQPEPARDLLDLDDTPPASSVSPQVTGTLSALQSQSTGITVTPSAPALSAVNDPFASSPFGPSSHHDLLGDHEDHVQTSSPPLQDQSAEIGNIKNQLRSTGKSLELAKGERAKMESTLASQAAELSALQTQLSSAKASYDTETTLLSQLKERFSTQAADIQTSREELIRAESNLSAIRVEKAEIEQAFLRDKEEARDLHRRMIEAGQQADQLKTEVEKAKKEAKQQKGRLAIARKQLSTKEAEKAKVEKELEETTAEVRSLIQEAEKAEDQLSKSSEQPELERAMSLDSVALAAAHPLPVSPDPMAPSKSNNPFDRLAKSSTTSIPQPQSAFLPFTDVAPNPPPVGFSEGQNGQAKAEPQSFDDFFGVHEPPAPLEPPKQSEVADTTLKDNSVRSPSSATDTDHFVTPPTTADQGSRPETPINTTQTQVPSMEDAIAHFPPLDSATNPTTNDKDNNHPNMTDLGTKLHEVEIEESDSDSDDDSPPAKVAREKYDTAVTPNQPTETPAIAASESSQPESSFDDIFGSGDAPTISTSDAPRPVPGPFDTSAADKVVEQVKPNPAAGVSAFDETLEGFSTPAAPAPAQFSFDAFEDSFDFAAAGNTQLPAQVSSRAPIVTAATTTTAPSDTASQSKFDDIFAAPSVAPPGLTTLSVPPTNGNATHELSKPTMFEDALGSLDTSPNLNLDASFTSVTSANPIEIASSPKPFHPSSTPASPKTVDTSSPRPSVNRSSSPAPGPTSPPRVASPKQRPVMSKDSHEKPKDPPPRHSKLSLRLPFGKRKNKHQEPMPPPPSHLSPPREGDDDVDAVKQITGMGFSRAQAVEALESHGYDVTRAINSLIQ